MVSEPEALSRQFAELGQPIIRPGPAAGALRSKANGALLLEVPSLGREPDKVGSSAVNATANHAAWIDLSALDLMA